MRKITRTIHFLLSVPAGIIISVICFSGATLVFEDEIMKLCYPSRFYIEKYVEKVDGKVLSVEVLIEKVKTQLPDTLSITSIQIAANPNENYRIGFAGSNRIFSAYVDPYSGKVVEIYDFRKGNFFLTMRQLHRWLLGEFKPGSPPVGKTVVGIATLVFVIILCTGIVLWFQRARKAFKANAKIRTGKGLKRFWYDLHVAGGIYVAIILLVCSLTGLTWSFDWYRTGFYKLFGAELPQTVQRQAPAPANARQQGGQSGGNQQNKGEKQGGGQGANRENTRDEQRQINFAVWQSVKDRLVAENSGFKTLSIMDGRALVSNSSSGNTRAFDQYVFDSQTGEITDSKLYKNQDKAGKLRGWIYSVHVGSWGGLATKIIAFVASLVGAILPFTGYYIFWRKRQKRKSRLQNS